MNVELIVDSTVDVPERVRSRLTVVPLTIHFGQEEFLDGVTMDRHRFYERLVESDVLPTTSQASPVAFDFLRFFLPHKPYRQVCAENLFCVNSIVSNFR